MCAGDVSRLTLWGRKATIVALIVVNKINFLKRMRFEAIHPNRYISPYEWPIASLFSANYSLKMRVQYSILFKYLLLSQMFPVIGFLKRYWKNQTRPSYSVRFISKDTPKQKIYRVPESPFCAEQNGKMRFCIGYFVYEIRVFKHMRVQKPL